MDLVSGWNSLWSAFTGGSASLNIILAAIGAGIIVFAILGWIISKRRGGGNGMSGFPWFMVIAGAILAAPTLLVPIILGVVQILINVVASLVSAFI